ncbi:hypothetical protein [Rhodopirellula sp. MGV]|uniref:hypothetical protein n=1 Tax=Rhodopirellula sp. MGV TaxID=2023130 RepID=UPI00117B13DB|nr:hypothetical protein [Rhodopirellula sp. MGV]
MTTYLYLRLENADATSRLVTLLGQGCEAAEIEGEIRWLRTAIASLSNPADSQTDLRKIPGTLFVGGADGLLKKWGDGVASVRIPDGLHWDLVDRLMRFEVPVASIAGSGRFVEPTELKLVRCDRERSCQAMIVEKSDLLRWVTNASELRLKRLRWCVNQTGQALVIGEPLPAINGRWLYQDGNVLIQAGFRFEPNLGGTDVLALFKRDGWLICQQDQPWALIDDDQLAAISRGSVRAWAHAEACGNSDTNVSADMTL